MKGALALMLMSAVCVQAGVPVGEVIKEKTGADIGTLTVGGAIRANYVNGDYPTDGTGKPQRGGNGGNFELDTFRINVDWEKASWLAKAEYRWYNGYNFFHTAWIGYALDENSQVQVGLNRVPFGVGAYGPANSWFFDQHYYVGLSDDMDVGVKYTRSGEVVSMDLAYYVAAEPNGQGSDGTAEPWAEESARYAYDVVDTDDPNAHYSERNQVNARVIASLLQESLPTDLGASLQLGQLVADDSATDDTFGWAASVHSSSTVGPWNLKLQLTGYDYRPDYNDPAQSDDLIDMGAYNYHDEVAAKGVIPAAALAYTWTADEYDWLNSITFYNDFSIILKDGVDNAGRGLKDSAMNVTGMAISAGGWYIYADYAYANGNYFVGDDGNYDDFGSNQTDGWDGRFNINFGYYF